MKANELRIGNYVWDDYSGEMIVSQIMYSTESVWFRKTWTLPDGHARCSDIKPIPLTDEWLLKFGFKKEGFSYLHNDLILHVFSNARLVSVPDEDGEWVNIQPPVQYVHQLQNLYFALTGEEL